MSYFYFDTGMHRFLSKKHDSLDLQKQVDNLIFSLSNASEVNLHSGFKSVWAPGLYLEAEALQQILLDKLKGASSAKKKIFKCICFIYVLRGGVQ